MNKIGETYIDSWNKIELWAEETGTDVVGNYSTVKTELKLVVVSGGQVSTSYSAGYVSGANETQLSGYYGPGTHTLLTGNFDDTHKADGSKTSTPSGWFGIVKTGQGFVSWGVSGSLNLTKFDRRASIGTFNGNDIKGNFSATYSTKSNGLSYRLRISIPGVETLETYKNYASGSNVTLSQASINYIRNYTNNSTIQLGGVIETWSGDDKIGESSEKRVTCKIAREVHVFVNGTDKKAIPYVRVNNEWKEAVPYIGVNGSWKEEN